MKSIDPVILRTPWIRAGTNLAVPKNDVGGLVATFAGVEGAAAQRCDYAIACVNACSKANIPDPEAMIPLMKAVVLRTTDFSLDTDPLLIKLNEALE